MSAMTNHKKLTDVTASLEGNCLSFTKKQKVKLKINQSVKGRDKDLVRELHTPIHWLVVLYIFSTMLSHGNLE